MGSHESETIKSEGTGNHFSEWLLFYLPGNQNGGERKLHSGKIQSYLRNMKEKQRWKQREWLWSCSRSEITVWL